MNKWLAGIAAALALVAGGAAWWLLDGRADPDGAAWFEDVTDAIGLDFVHDAGDFSNYDMRGIIGSGAALFDCDGDGRLDLYLLTNGGPSSKATNRLYRQKDDGTFEDITARSGLGLTGWSMGVAVGDIDNDGRPDVLVTQYGGVRLFRNEGGGTFRDITASAGLANPLWATSANFFDYDRDGRLDLVVVNYIDYDPAPPCNTRSGARDYCNPSGYPGTVTKLFRNDGTAGTAHFTDVTVAAGLARAVGPGLGVSCADFDGDGWPDVFVANDGQPNRLWMNQKDGTFVEQAFARGVAVDALGRAQAGMGIAVGDTDGDGLFDLFVTHLTAESNTLWVQGPRGQFRDRTAAAGLAAARWRGTGFGTVLADFDHDGWPDLALVNGRVTRGAMPPYPALGPHLQDYAERNQVFRNGGQGQFKDVSLANPALCGTPNVARGLVCGDLDGDGAPDLVVTTVGGRARVFRNVAPNRGHWLRVRGALDPALKRDAYGAIITVEVGGRRLVRTVNPGDSYLSSGDVRAHFGLGGAARYEAIRVHWPDGSAERFGGGDGDRDIVLRKGEGVRE